MDLGRYGVWARKVQLDADTAHEIEALGYGTVWIGGADGDLELAERLLAATSTLVVATGIVNIWTVSPTDLARAYARVEDRFPGRFLLGVGTGHRESVGAVYQKPFDALVRFVDGLDAGDVPPQRRVLAALGPRVLRLAAERSAGAHPYLTPPQHTRFAREVVGPGVLLAPEQKAVLVADPGRARDVGRPAVAKPYLGLANYVANLRRLGYTDDDLAGTGSDRLIDDLVAHGTPEAVADRLRQHLDAGADHVCVQIVPDGDTGIVAPLRELATALF